jgi:toxin ParE1/3/4
VAGRPTRLEVLLTKGSEQDLESIQSYIAEFDTEANANHVLDRLTEVLKGLAQSSARGNYPKEFVTLDIKDYRSTVFKPHQVLYRVLNGKVIIHLVAASRRDMQSVLTHRSLGA